ncbi:MAG TPA: methylmalonyl Co-A mutase-associated GTPase MeaB [Candidatus Fimivivens faecavium]|nr:methylmalonyl Co-A mutase-associated GTPase MeaB [Candidatus Fimivivens faecavium]
MGYDTYKPDWTPECAGDEFACQVMTGIDEEALRKAKAKAVPAIRRRELSVDEYVKGILACDRMILARAITLIESNAPKHFELGQEIIQKILPYTGKAVRVGITGVPGAGKSTFIEALGNLLCDRGKKIAVLAVDPSSHVSGGSILGDKTRMEQLVKQPNAFIRPSPSGGTLGGVTRKSRETLLLCEAAGFDTILVETVGVGQSETTVRSMVDFFLVIALTGAGDDLQGIKKGVIETADAILVNKADGDNKRKAMVARSEYEQVLHYLRPATEGWTTKAYTCSALTGEGISEIWDVVMDFMSQMEKSGTLLGRRQQQTLTWVWQMAEEHIRNSIVTNPNVVKCMEAVRNEIMADQLSATKAAQTLIDAIEFELKSGISQ